MGLNLKRGDVAGGIDPPRNGAAADQGPVVVLIAGWRSLWRGYYRREDFRQPDRPGLPRAR